MHQHPLERLTAPYLGRSLPSLWNLGQGRERELLEQRQCRTRQLTLPYDKHIRWTQSDTPDFSVQCCVMGGKEDQDL